MTTGKSGSERHARQFEILGLCLSSPLTISSLEMEFRCGRATVERDLNALRSAGLSVHSTRTQGVQILGRVPEKAVEELVSRYLVSAQQDVRHDKATRLLVAELGERAFPVLTLVHRSLRRKRLVVVDYQKDIDVVERRREIGPVRIFQRENSWRVLAMNDGQLKQYVFAKILAIGATKKTFEPPAPEHVDELFAHSFQSWLGRERIRVELQLSPIWGKAIRLRPVLVDQTVREQADGTYSLEGTVNSLAEFASWVASRGRGVKVISPAGLRERVMQIGRGVLANYAEER